MNSEDSVLLKDNQLSSEMELWKRKPRSSIIKSFYFLFLDAKQENKLHKKIIIEFDFYGRLIRWKRRRKKNVFRRYKMKVDVIFSFLKYVSDKIYLVLKT